VPGELTRDCRSDGNRHCFSFYDERSSGVHASTPSVGAITRMRFRRSEPSATEELCFQVPVANGELTFSGPMKGLLGDFLNDPAHVLAIAARSLLHDAFAIDARE
jgi:hypothetical protein